MSGPRRTPACAQAHWVSPEQSKLSGPFAPTRRVYRVGSVRRSPAPLRGLKARRRRADRHVRPGSAASPPRRATRLHKSAETAERRAAHRPLVERAAKPPPRRDSALRRADWRNTPWIAAVTPWRRHAACRRQRPAGAPAGTQCADQRALTGGGIGVGGERCGVGSGVVDDASRSGVPSAIGAGGLTQLVAESFIVTGETA